jgi:hypothetical protein
MAEKDENVLEEQDEQQEDKEVELVPVDDKKPTDSEEDGEDEEDTRLSEENEDREETRKRRRAEKEDRAARRKAAIERDKRELNFLRMRNEDLEKRITSVETRTAKAETQTLQERINEAIAEAKAAERIMAKAVEAGEGEDVTKAMRIRDEAMRKAQAFTQAKQQMEFQAKQPKNAQPDPEVAIMAKKWVSANSWYDPKGKDEDSQIVQLIDKRLTEEGYNPRTEDYWRELDKRVAKRLPDKKKASQDYDDEDDEVEDRRPSGRRGPMIGGSREHAPASTRKEVYVSPERKNAMVQAGVWDDPVLRQRYLKQYAKWDRENKSAR